MSHGRGVIIDAGERSRRRAAEEAAKEIQTYYSGLRAATPLARSSTGLQAASAASARSKGRSRGPPGEVSDLTLGQKGTWLSREVSLPREVPDPSQFQSDSEPRGEEFEDAQSCQDSGNPEAGGAVTEGTYESVAARKQHEGAREVGNEGRVNARTGAGNEKRQEVRVVDRDQGSRTRQAEFDDRESLIPQVSVSSVQERIDEQRRKSYDPNSLGTQGSVAGNREVWQGLAWAEGAADRKRIVSVEADTSGVINRSSGSDSGQPLEARNDEQRGVGLERRSLREGLRPRAFSTPQEAATVRQGRGGFSVGGSPSRQSLEDPELEWDPFLEEEEDMAERPMFHYKEPEKFRGTPKENAMEWIDRAIDVSLEGAAYKWIVGLEARNARPEHWEDREVQVAGTEDEPAHYREVRGLKTLFLKQFVAVNLKRQTERKLRMRVQGKEEDITEYYHDVMDMCRMVQPDMAEEVRIDHLFRGLSPALYERLYVLGIKSCEEFLEEARLHADAVKTAYERGYEDSRRECEKPAVGAVGLDKVQDLQRQIQELRDELARAGDPSKRKEKEEDQGKPDPNAVV
ncbi:hypothetical protein OUZ56_033206 [Daphnia magna]|uniref:Retrotransposon gag domain-containing protein n=1 Tax=Daphnia magna TaxID=35525 RepID=A0ABQ9ZXH3_9CRUS|nr:hypothetical protein OUZ56_033206 [Daphnia magna]